MLDNRYCKTAIEGFLGGYHYPLHKEGSAFSESYEIPFKDGYYEHIMNAGEYIAVNLFSPIEARKRTVQTQEFKSISSIWVNGILNTLNVIIAAKSLMTVSQLKWQVGNSVHHYARKDTFCQKKTRLFNP